MNKVEVVQHLLRQKSVEQTVLHRVGSPSALWSLQYESGVC